MKRLLWILALVACTKPIATVKEKVKTIAEEISAPLGTKACARSSRSIFIWTRIFSSS